MIALSCRLADDGGGRGNLLHHVKWEGELPGRGISGEYVRGRFDHGNARITSRIYSLHPCTRPAQYDID